MTRLIPKSLVARLGLWAFLLFVISIPLFWVLYSSAAVGVSREVVDTRIIEFADQVRGYWASSQSPGAGRGVQNPNVGIGGPDIGWVWQISVNGKVADRSPLLTLSATQLPVNITEAGTKFTLQTLNTPLGEMRLAERIIREIPPVRPGRPAPEALNVHYVVGIDIARYGDYVEQHSARLGNLAVLAVIPVSLVLLGMLAFIILVIRRDFRRVADAMHTYEAGETEGITGKFPGEIEGLVSQMNRLLHQNMKLVERTRKYVSKIAHDINHPLAIMKNGLQGDVDKDLLGRQVDRMAGLVDRYSSLARAIGPDGVAGRETRIAEMMRDVAEGFSIMYRRNPLAIDSECDPELSFQAPRHDLEAMVSNLVSNSHKFAETRIVLSARLEESNLVLCVEDDGPGIADSEYEAALNWGKRLDEAPPGTGFGLSIVKDIADLYQGEMILGRSNLGGLKVDIVLPRKNQE